MSSVVKYKKKTIANAKKKDKLPVDICEKLLYVVNQLEEDGYDLVTLGRRDPKWFYQNFIKPILPRNVNIWQRDEILVTIDRPGEPIKIEHID